MDVQNKAVTPLHGGTPFSCSSESITSLLSSAESSLNSSAAYFKAETLKPQAIQHSPEEPARHLSHQIWTSLPFLSSSHLKTKCNLLLFLHRHFLVTKEWSVQPHSVWQYINSWGWRADSKCNVIFTEDESTRLTFKLPHLEISTFSTFPIPEASISRLGRKAFSPDREESQKWISPFGLSSSTPVSQWVLKSRMFIPVHY